MRRPLLLDRRFLCAFAPNYTVLLVLRLLYGIGMGGEWGLGAALAMEKLPANRRGFFSGVLQQGYAIGYLLAALAYLVSAHARAVVAVVVRAQRPAGPDQPAHPGPGRGVGGRGRDARKLRADNTSLRDGLLQRPGAPPLRLSGLAHGGVQLDEPRHAGRLPDLPQGDGDGGAGLSATTAMLDRDHLQHRRDRSAARSSGRCPSASAGVARSRSAACSGCRSFRCSPSRKRCAALPRLLPHAGGGAGGMGRHPGASHRDVTGRHPRLLSGVTYQLGNCLAAFNLPIQQSLAAATATRSP